jgi:hypothetical protein
MAFRDSSNPPHPSRRQTLKFTFHKHQIAHTPSRAHALFHDPTRRLRIQHRHHNITKHYNQGPIELSSDRINIITTTLRNPPCLNPAGLGQKEDHGRDKMDASISTAKQVFISRRGSPGFFPSSITSGKGLAKGLSVGSESIDLWRKPFSIFLFFFHFIIVIAIFAKRNYLMELG